MRPATYPDDLHICALQTAEQFVLVTARLWVARHLKPEAPGRSLEAGMAAAGLPQAGYLAFDALFTIVSTAARRSLDVRCVHCAGVSADEARLLQMVSCIQNRGCASALELLEDWLPPAAARLGIGHLAMFAEALADRGLTVAERHRHAGKPTAYADRGLALVQ